MKKGIVGILFALVICVSVFVACGGSELERALDAKTLKSALNNVTIAATINDHPNALIVTRDNDSYCIKNGSSNYYVKKANNNYYMYSGSNWWDLNNADFLVYFSLLTALNAGYFEAVTEDGWYKMKETSYANYLSAISTNYYAEFYHGVNQNGVGIIENMFGGFSLENVDYVKIKIDGGIIKNAEASLSSLVYTMTLSDYGNTAVTLPDADIT